MVTAVRIPWGEGEVSGNLIEGGDVGVLLAHGAGTNHDHPFLTLLRDQLASFGLTVLSFNYAYTERGGRRPDNPNTLLRVHRAAADHLAALVPRVVLAGRSMGGRIGLYLAAEGWPASAVILYAYPLHPAGKPDRLRVDRFGQVSVPMLFFQGTRDALSRMDLFDEHVRTLPRVTVETLPGATHSPHGGGWTIESTADFLAERSAAWLTETL